MNRHTPFTGPERNRSLACKEIEALRMVRAMTAQRQIEVTRNIANWPSERAYVSNHRPEQQLPFGRARGIHFRMKATSAPSARKASDPEAPMVVILMATYQGVRFLHDQLDSICRQTHKNWSLIVSDDGSDDGTMEILEDFARQHRRVTLLHGPRKGATNNFLCLLENAPPNTMVAFCDQDDVWLPDKLARAVKALNGTTNPAHYAARTLICDENLKTLAASRRFQKRFGFQNALVQACMAGNTSVFNAPAAAILKAGVEAARRANVPSHDWWAYQLLSGSGAEILRDDQPVLLYRQHGRSEMGRNDTPAALAARLRWLLAGRFGDWMHANVEALSHCTTLLPEHRATLAMVEHAFSLPGPIAANVMRRAGLYRHTHAGTIALYAAAFAGRLRKHPQRQTPEES